MVSIEMALPSKGLRKITVDGEEFQYRISRPKPLDCPVIDGQFMDHPMGINIYVQSASDPKSIFNHLHAFEEYLDLPSVTPANLADLIRRARASGWQPNESGHFSTEGWELDPRGLTRKRTTLTTLSSEEMTGFVRRYSRYNLKTEIRHHK